MAAQENLLALKNQRPSELKNDAKEVGGPKNTFSTAEYASFSFDPAVGIVQDNTVGATAKVGPRASELPGVTGPAKSAGVDAPTTFGEVHEGDDSEEDKKKDDLKEDDVDLDGDGDDDSVDLDLDDLTDDLDTIDLDEEEDSDDKKDEVKEEESCDSDDKKDLDEGEEEDSEDKTSKDELDEENDEDGDNDGKVNEGEIPPQFRKDGDGDGKKDTDGDGDDDDDKKEKKDVKESKLQPFKIKINFSEGSKLFESNQTLSEDDKRQSKALFESAVRNVAKSIAGQLREAYQKRFDEAKALNEANTAKKVDQYLNYVVEQWVVDNKVPLRNQLRSKLTENFMRGMRDLFNANYVEIPAGKVDVVKALAGNVKALKTKLKLAEEKNVVLHNEKAEVVSRERKALVKEHKARLIAEASLALTPSERGKFSESAKALGFTNTKNFRKDLIALREQYVAADKGITERPLPVPDARPLFENKQEQPKSEVDDYIAAAARIS